MRCRTAGRDTEWRVAHRKRGIAAAAAALVAAAATLCACTTSVTGRAVRHAKPSVASISARGLLLQSGDTTPLGPAEASTVGSNYFTSARPAECSAALLFEGSPLRPAAAADHAESGYRFSGPALYAESVDAYDTALKPNDVVRDGFRAVSGCTGDAVGISSAGSYPPMKLSFFATPADGLLVWTMTRPEWTCDYGLAVIPRVALLLPLCDAKPGFPMAQWAAKRKVQLDSRAA